MDSTTGERQKINCSSKFKITPLHALFLVATILMAGCQENLNSGRVDLKTLQVQVGTGGMMEKDRWNRVLISAKTIEGVFEGELVISAQNFNHVQSSEKFSCPFEVSVEKQNVEIPIFPREDWDKLILTFRSKRTLDSVSVPLNWQRSPRFRVLGIGNLPLYLDVGARKWLKLEYPTDITMGAISAREMPIHFLGYEVADLIIVSESSILDANEDQLNALSEWVRRGGHLAAIPTASWSGRVPEGIQEIFGMTSPPVVVHDSKSTASYFEKRLGIKESSNLEGVFFEVHGMKGVLSREKDLLFENHHGSGRAYFFTFAPPGSFLKKDTSGSMEIPAMARLWERIVLEAAPGQKTLAKIKNAKFESQAVWLLHKLSGSKFPSITKVFIFVIGYLVVGFFLMGYLFGRKKRLERMYLVSLVLAITSSIGIFYFGFLSGIHTTTVNEVTVGVLRPDAKTLEATSYLGIASPRRQTMEPQFSSAGDSVIMTQPNFVPQQNSFQAMGSFGAANNEYKLLPLKYRLSGNTLRIPELALYPNDSRYLRLDHAIDIGGKLEAKVGYVGVGGQPGLLVSNKTTTSFNIFLLQEGHISGYGSVNQGQTKEFALTDGKNVLNNMNSNPGAQFFNKSSNSIECFIEFRKQLYLNLHFEPEDDHFKLLESHRPYLIAQTDRSLTSAESLAPMREMMTFIIVELVKEGDWWK